MIYINVYKSHNYERQVWKNKFTKILLDENLSSRWFFEGNVYYPGNYFDFLRWLKADGKFFIKNFENKSILYVTFENYNDIYVIYS